MILNELKYTTIHNITVTVPFYASITINGGNSSSGKSFIKDTVQEYYNDVDRRIVEVFDYKALIDLAILRSLKNRLIIVDNADILLPGNKAVCEYINEDADNQYLLFMRNENDIDASADNYAELQETVGTGKQLSAVYSYR
jgi:hypothetical protein